MALIYIIVGWVLKSFYDINKEDIDPIFIKLKEFALSMVAKLKSKLKK